MAKKSKIIATIKVEAPKARSGLFVVAVARGSRRFRNRRRERRLAGWTD